MFSLVSFSTAVNSPPVHEEFNPRRNRTYAYLFNEPIDNAMAIGDQAIIDMTSVPWKAMGIVTYDRYLNARKRAFELAGIDENDPEDDTRRFSFYRGLGVAVRRTGNTEQRVYIPFGSLRNFVEQNSGYRFEDWKEIMPNSGSKLHSALLGRAFFKADSKSQGGDEDGTVDNIEWSSALNQMGYRTMEYEVAKLLGNNTVPREELERLVADMRTNPDYLSAPIIIPTSKLEAYVSSN